MKPSPPYIWPTVADFLKGVDDIGHRVTRSDLSGRNPCLIIHVTVAMVLARGSAYNLFAVRDGKSFLRLPYNKLLHRLAVVGLQHHRYAVNGRTLVGVSGTYGLHASAERRVFFTPPPELTELVDKYSNSRAIRIFYEDAAKAATLAELSHPTEIAGKGSPEEQADRVYLWLRGLPPPVYAHLASYFQQS